MNGKDTTLTYQEFATKIKDKYPQYKDIDDYELAKKLVDKYPQYRDKVSLKKKEDQGEESSWKQKFVDFFSQIGSKEKETEKPDVETKEPGQPDQQLSEPKGVEKAAASTTATQLQGQPSFGYEIPPGEQTPFKEGEFEKIAQEVSDEVPGEIREKRAKEKLEQFIEVTQILSDAKDEVSQRANSSRQRLNEFEADLLVTRLDPTGVRTMGATKTTSIREDAPQDKVKEYKRMKYSNSMIQATGDLVGQQKTLLENVQKAEGFATFGEGIVSGLQGYFEQYTDIINNIARNPAMDNLKEKVEKYNRDEIDESAFTEEEILFLTTTEKHREIVGEMRDKLPVSHEIGEMMGHSIAFMGEFALTAGVGGSVLKGVKATGKGAIGLAKKFGTATGKKMAQAGVQTMVMPSFISKASENIATKEGKDAVEGVWNAYADNWIEVFSERIFMGSVSGISTGTAMDKVVSRLGNAMAGRRGVKGWMKGFAEEFTEEQIAEVGHMIQRGKSLSEMKDQMTDINRQGKIAAVTGIMTGTMGASLSGYNTVNNSMAKYRLNKSGQKINSDVKKQIDEMVENPDHSTGEVIETINDIANYHAAQRGDTKEAVKEASDIAKYGQRKIRDVAYESRKEIEKQAKEAPKEEKKQAEQAISQEQKKRGEGLQEAAKGVEGVTERISERQKRKPEEELEAEEETSYRIGEQEFSNKEEFLSEIEKYKGQENVPEFEVRNDETTLEQATETLQEGLEQPTEVEKPKTKPTGKKQPTKPKVKASKAETKEIPTPKTIKKGQRFQREGETWEFTGEKDNVTGDYIAETLGKDKKKTRIAPGAVESLKFVGEIAKETKQPAKPKTKTKQTVEIGKEKKASASEARILKSEPGNTFNRPINVGGEKVGNVTIEKSGNEWIERRVDIEPKQQGKGYAKEVYRQINKQAQQEGATFRSDRADKINDNARGLWDSLVKSGEAVKEDGRYRMISSEQIKQPIKAEVKPKTKAKEKEEPKKPKTKKTVYFRGLDENKELNPEQGNVSHEQGSFIRLDVKEDGTADAYVDPVSESDVNIIKNQFDDFIPGEVFVKPGKPSPRGGGSVTRVETVLPAKMKFEDGKWKVTRKGVVDLGGSVSRAEIEKIAETIKNKGQETKQPTKPKEKTKAAPVSEIAPNQLEGLEQEQAKKTSEKYNQLAGQLNQLPEGESTTNIGKEFAKISKNLPQQSKKQFIDELKRKEQQHQKQQQEILESGNQVIESTESTPGEYVEMMDRAENMDKTDNPKKLRDDYNKIKGKLTKQQQQDILDKLKEKQDEFIKNRNKQKKEESKKQIDEAIRGITEIIGTTKGITGDAKPELHENLKQLAHGLFDYSMTHFDELWRNMKEKIKRSIPDRLKQKNVLKEMNEIKEELQQEFENMYEEVIPREQLEQEKESIDDVMEEIKQATVPQHIKDLIDVKDKYGFYSEGSRSGRKRNIKRVGLEGIIKRRAQMQLDQYIINKFVLELKKKHTKKELEVMPFLIEGTQIPKRLNRPDLEQTYKELKDAPHMKETVDIIRKHYDNMWKFIVNNIDDLSDQQIENYVTHIWRLPNKRKNEIFANFVTKNRFLNKRYIETLKEGIERYGLEPKILDISELIRIHGLTTVKVAANQDFVDYVQRMHEEGMPLILPKSRAPQYAFPRWKQFEHPALRKITYAGKTKKGVAKLKDEPVMIDGDLFPVVNAVLGGDLIKPTNFTRVYDVLATHMKKAQLHASFFHHWALIESGLGKMGAIKTSKAMVKITQALRDGKPPAFENTQLAEMALSKYVIQIGASQDVNLNMVQQHLEGLADYMDRNVLDKIDEKVFDKKGLARNFNLIRGFAKGNKAWDNLLWQYLHDGLKLYAVEHAEQNMPKWVREGSQEQMRRWRIQQGQIINDTFGGQNVDMLMMNPKTWNFLKYALLSRDWTLSTVRQFLAPTGIGDIYKGTLGRKDASFKERRKEYWDIHKGRMQTGTAFWIRGMAYHWIGMNLLNIFNRTKDKDENPEYYLSAEFKGNELPIYREEDTGQYYIPTGYGDQEERNYLTKRKDGFFFQGEKLKVEDNMPDFEDYLINGNAPGHRSLLFQGRAMDGVEDYLRPGKQFREVPELFWHNGDFMPGWTTVRKIGGKAAPIPQYFATLFTGSSLSGYEDWDLKDKEGKEWWAGVAKMTAKKFTPFSMSNIVRGDRKYKWMDSFLPRNKGMTEYQAIKEYEKALKKDDYMVQYDAVDEIYDYAVRNGLDAYGLLTVASNNVNYETIQELKATYKDIEELQEKIDQEKAKPESDQNKMLLYRLGQQQFKLMEDKAGFDYARERQKYIKNLLEYKQQLRLDEEEIKLKK